MKQFSFSSLLTYLHSLSNKDNIEGMSRYGIKSKKVLGINAPVLRKLAKQIGKDHALARELWSTEILEARILAALVDDPKLVTERQMDEWVHGFDNWAICDGCCSNLFDKTSYAYKKAFDWVQSEKEFVRRAGFVMMAALAVHDKKSNDEWFISFLPIIKEYAIDERNFVKKAVNWSLRQIGKRNFTLNNKAVQLTREIHELDSKSAKWIASDALRELTSEAVQKRLGKKYTRSKVKEIQI